jgi:hypothetical protein
MLSLTFKMAWRFADPRFNVLPPEYLQQLEEVPPKEAEQIWKTHMSVDHLLLLPARPRDIPLQTIEVDWSNPVMGGTLLSQARLSAGRKHRVFLGAPYRRPNDLVNFLEVLG